MQDYARSVQQKKKMKAGTPKQLHGWANSDASHGTRMGNLTAWSTVSTVCGMLVRGKLGHRRSGGPNGLGPEDSGQHSADAYMTKRPCATLTAPKSIACFGKSKMKPIGKFLC